MYSATRKPRTHPEVWRREDAQSIPGSRDCRSSRTCSSCLSPGLTSALLWSTSGTTETPGCLHLQLWVQLKMQIRPPRLRTNPLPVSVFHYSYHSRGRNFVFSEKYFSFNYHLYFQLLSGIFANHHCHSFSFPQPQLRHFQYNAVCITV